MSYFMTLVLTTNFYPRKNSKYEGKWRKKTLQDVHLYRHVLRVVATDPLDGLDRLIVREHFRLVFFTLLVVLQRHLFSHSREDVSVKSSDRMDWGRE